MKLTVILSVLILSTFTLTLSAQEHAAKLLDDAFTRAINANDVDAIVALYAPNATVYPPDVMQASGKDGIRALFEGMLAANTVKNFHMMETKYETQGNISIGWGRWMMTLTPKAGGEEMHLEGRFTEVAKQIDGKWFYLVDHASAPLAPPPTQTQTSTMGK